MEKQWKILDHENCPNCGDLLEVFSKYHESGDFDGQLVEDGEDVRCANLCGFVSSMSADEDGVWVQDGNIDEL